MVCVRDLHPTYSSTAVSYLVSVRVSVRLYCGTRTNARGAAGRAHSITMITQVIPFIWSVVGVSRVHMWRECAHATWGADERDETERERAKQDSKVDMRRSDHTDELTSLTHRQERGHATSESPTCTCGVDYLDMAHWVGSSAISHLRHPRRLDLGSRAGSHTLLPSTILRAACSMRLVRHDASTTFTGPVRASPSAASPAAGC